MTLKEKLKELEKDNIYVSQRPFDGSPFPRDYHFFFRFPGKDTSSVEIIVPEEVVLNKADIVIAKSKMIYKELSEKLG